MVILDPNDMNFDAVSPFGLVFQLLFKFGSSYCAFVPGPMEIWQKRKIQGVVDIFSGTGGTLWNP